MLARILISFLTVFALIGVKQQLYGTSNEVSSISKYKTDLNLMKLGHKHLLIKDCDKAIELFNKIVKNLDRWPEESLREKGVVYNSLGSSYLCKDDFEKALTCFKQSLSIREQRTDSIGIANSYSNIGLVYSKSNDLNNALIHYQKALNLFRSISYDVGIANELNNIGKIFYLYEKYDTAQTCFLNSIDLSYKLNDSILLLDNHRDLANNYFAQKQYDKANEQFQKTILITDDLAKKNAINLAEAQTDYEIENQRLKTNLLTKENEFKQKALEAQRNKQFGLIITLFLLLICCGLLAINYVNYKRRKQTETTGLLNELKLLKTKAIVENSVNDEGLLTNLKSHKDIINGSVNNKLNETDWNILEIIYGNPTITNKEIADRVHLTNSGLRSSFKKMYLLFNIDDRSGNKRLSLVIKITRIIKG